jgi:hypothetical protein
MNKIFLMPKRSRLAAKNVRSKFWMHSKTGQKNLRFVTIRKPDHRISDVDCKVISEIPRQIRFWCHFHLRLLATFAVVRNWRNFEHHWRFQLHLHETKRRILCRQRRHWKNQSKRFTSRRRPAERGL